jgi:hypothetical protein
MELAKADGLFFDYVNRELVPSIRQDNYDLAQRLEEYTYPIKTEGVKRKILTGFRHALTRGSELKDRKKILFNYLRSLPEDEKFIINIHAKTQALDNADEAGILKSSNYNVILNLDEYRKAVFAQAIAKVTE